MKAVAWAVLDAEGAVIDTTVSRDEAITCAADGDGWHIQPLVLADLDEVTE